MVPDVDGAIDGDVYNVILWLDQRAVAEAEQINDMTHEDVRKVRGHFGDRISPENEPPKLMWLNKYKPEAIREGMFFDLADWIAFKCCGDATVRSSCTVGPKWGWGSEVDGEGNGRWTRKFWEELGLSVLCEEDFRKIGRRIVKAGRGIGRVCRESAEELGVSTECLVASPMVDAYAGSLWSMGAGGELIERVGGALEKRLSVVCGTSTCLTNVSRKQLFMPGVWGPFRDAVIPGFHATAGGQSVSGKLLENTIERHAAFPGLCERVGKEGVYDTLTRMTQQVVAEGGQDPAEHVHCLDYHVGNRSPLADPTLKGCMVGLTLSKDEYDLAVKFRATVQALCYGMRHIIEEMRKWGHEIGVIMACGGLCKNRMFLQELADCVSVPVVLCEEEKAMLLGGAILGRACVIAENGGELLESMLKSAKEMTRVGETVLPDERRRKYHDRKYRVYRELQIDFTKYRKMMTTDE